MPVVFMQDEPSCLRILQDDPFFFRMKISSPPGDDDPGNISRAIKADQAAQSFR
jgi:hypothetical protein